MVGPYGAFGGYGDAVAPAKVWLVLGPAIGGKQTPIEGAVYPGDDAGKAAARAHAAQVKGKAVLRQPPDPNATSSAESTKWTGTKGGGAATDDAARAERVAHRLEITNGMRAAQGLPPIGPRPWSILDNDAFGGFALIGITPKNVAIAGAVALGAYLLWRR